MGGPFRDLAADQGVRRITRQAVWQHLAGKMPIGLEASIRWAEVLHCDPAEIRPDLADRFDAVTRLRGGAVAASALAPNAALLRACLSAAFDEARKADRYPTNDLIASLAIDLYTKANQPARTMLERVSATQEANHEG